MQLDHRPSQFKLRQERNPERCRVRLHQFLIEQLEKRGLDVVRISRGLVREHIADLVSQFVEANGVAVNNGDRERLIDDMIDEILGYGPLEPLFQDDSITDILVNGPYSVMIERGGCLENTTVKFVDEHHAMRVLQRMLAPTGRRLDESSPMVDARLVDGSRLNAIIAPLTLDGPSISIRRARRDRLSVDALLENEFITADTLSFLRGAVERKLNILVSGGTGAGKTTLLNLLGQFISPAQRIIIIEDASELQFNHPHVVYLETRPPNAEGQGEVTARDIVRNVLRMRPDRIVIGEVRGVEVMDLLQAMNTGHDGSMSTLHANSPSDSLSRLEMLVGFTGYRGSEGTLRSMVAAALDLLVHVSRMPDGKRRVTSIQELVECREGEYVLNSVYEFSEHGRAFSQIQSTYSPELEGVAGV